MYSRTSLISCAKLSNSFRWKTSVLVGTGPHLVIGNIVEGRKDAKVQQDESYPSTGDLAALNTSCHTGFAPDTHCVPDSHVSTGVRSVSRPCTLNISTYNSSIGGLSLLDFIDHRLHGSDGDAKINFQLSI